MDFVTYMHEYDLNYRVSVTTRRSGKPFTVTESKCVCADPPGTERRRLVNELVYEDGEVAVNLIAAFVKVAHRAPARRPTRGRICWRRPRRPPRSSRASFRCQSAQQLLAGTLGLVPWWLAGLRAVTHTCRAASRALTGVANGVPLGVSSGSSVLPCDSERAQSRRHATLGVVQFCSAHHLRKARRRASTDASSRRLQYTRRCCSANVSGSIWLTCVLRMRCA